MPQESIANCKLKIANCKLRSARTFRWHSAFVAALWLTACGLAVGQELVPPGTEPLGMDPGAAPVTHMGDASFFSQDLGTIVRLRYNTESYGQDHHGNFDVGTMQVITLDGSSVFFDGQVTLNDSQGVGFNLGVGYRFLSFPRYALDTGRVEGVSLWVDGTSTEGDNFFPQIGVSYESLGDMWDFRTNAYIPVGEQDQVGEFRETGEIGFQGNSLSQLTQAVVDSSFYAGEVEVARRLGSERDAWGFAGPYFLANDDDDTVGYRAGLRGYAYPDLLLQVAVSDDEIFNTNATFSVMWFVGRTRTDYRPACGVPDRLREPVLRNDYVVLAQSFVTDGIPLTQPDGEALRIVHVDSSAPEGGDGTFENPFNMLTDINGAGSGAGDIILAHAESVFSGEASTMLKADQRLLGEGDGFVHTVVTAEEGTFDIPETAPGAGSAPRPVVENTLADAVILAPGGNEVTNFDFEDVNGNAIFGMGLTGNVTLRELDVTNGEDFAISLVDVATTSSVTLDEFTYDGGAAPDPNAAGGIELVNFDGTFNATDGTLTNGTQAGICIAANGTDNSDGTITFADTFIIDSVDNADGAAFEVDGFTGVLNINGTIENDIGKAVSIQNMDTGAAVTFGATADITHTTTGADAEGVFIANNSDGTIAFNGDLILTTNGSIAFDTDEAGNDVTLTAPGANNSINTTNAIGLRIVGTEIGTAGVNFPTLNASGGTNGVFLLDNTGGPINVGTLGDQAGESGTIAATGDAVVIDNSANVTVSGIRINNPAAVSGVLVTKETAGTQTTNLNDVEINNGAFGVEVTGNGTGTLNLTVNDSEIRRSTNAGFSVDNIDAGQIQVNNTTLDGDNLNATADGVRITGSNATFTFDINPTDDNTVIRDFGGDEFEVDDGSPNVTMHGSVVNTSGRSVFIHNVDGGSVTFTANSSIDDNGAGMLVEDNSGGTFTFLGDNDLNTGANTAVTIDNNTGATISLSNLNIDTGIGNGFVATNGGTLTVLGTTNTIDTVDGVGLRIEDMTIGAADVAFQTVNVTSGNTNGIILRDLGGTGQVAIGNTAGAQNSGGTLTTTGDAIVLENVADVDLLHLQVVNAGGQGVNIDHSTATNMDVTIQDLNLDASSGAGIDVLHSSANLFNLRINDSDLEERVEMDIMGAGDFRLLVDNTDVTTGGTDVAFELSFSGSTVDGDVTIRNTSTFTAANAEALLLTADGANPSIELAIDNNTFVNTSNTDRTVEILASNGAELNANVTNNSFTNSGTAEELQIESDGPSSQIDLNLIANGPMGAVLRLRTDNNGGGINFSVVNRDNADANNAGNVIFDPAIGDFGDIDISEVEAPTVP